MNRLSMSTPQSQPGKFLQPGVGGDLETVKIQLHATIKRHPQSLFLPAPVRFVRRLGFKTGFHQALRAKALGRAGDHRFSATWAWLNCIHNAATYH